MADLLLNPGSYLGIIIFLILTGCGLPIPEEVPIVTAGVLSAQGTLNPVAAFISCLIGALLGDCVMYGIGYRWGHSLVREHPRFARFFHAEREAKFEELIRRHGLKVLFAARFMVGVRSPVYLTAGIMRVSFRRFLLMDLLCATAVVGLFFWLTFIFGEHLAGWLQRAEIGLTTVVVVALLAALGFFYWRRKKRLARLEDVKIERLRRAQERQRRQLGRQNGTLAS